MTRCPSARSRSHRCEPRKPAPPVTTHVATRRSLAVGAIQGVVCQQLLPRADGQGRVAAREILIVMPAVANLIREGKTHQIYTAMQTGAQYGMRTMDASLAELVRHGEIDTEVAMSKSSNPDELRRIMRG